MNTGLFGGGATGQISLDTTVRRGEDRRMGGWEGTNEGRRKKEGWKGMCGGNCAHSLVRVEVGRPEDVD